MIKNKKFSVVLWFLLVINIFGPLILVTIWKIEAPLNYTRYVDALTYIGILYLILLIQRNRDRETFHIDKSVLLFVLIAGFVLLIIISSVSLLLLFIFIGVSVYLMREIIRGLKIQKSNENDPSESWVFAKYLFWGVLIGLVIYVLRPFNISSTEPLTQLWAKLIVEFGKAAVNEEILIRGLFWGYLVSLGLKERAILFLQAIIFSMGHVANYGSFFVSFVIFIIGIILGLSAWKLRSVTPAIIGHALANTLIYFF